MVDGVVDAIIIESPNIRVNLILKILEFSK